MRLRNPFKRGRTTPADWSDIEAEAAEMGVRILWPFVREDPLNGCQQCGMKDVDDEFHPHALCLLVGALEGRTEQARGELAYVLERALSGDEWTQARIATFIERVAKEGKRDRETVGANHDH